MYYKCFLIFLFLSKRSPALSIYIAETLVNLNLNDYVNTKQLVQIVFIRVEWETFNERTIELIKSVLVAEKNTLLSIYLWLFYFKKLIKYYYDFIYVIL